MNRFPRFRRRLDAKMRRSPRVRPQLELLEARNLLSGPNLGPLVQVTSTDPFAGNTADNPASFLPAVFYPSSEVEPYIAVNPTNPKNLVGAWMQDEWSTVAARGLDIGVSFNGGNSWSTSVVPGLTQTAGGTYNRAADVWLSFAPNGDLYFTGLLWEVQPSGAIAPSAVVVEKSTDGGQTFSAPITLMQSADPATYLDADSVTADPTTPGYAYAVWDQAKDSNSASNYVLFSRTTNGGQSWSTPSTIFSSGGSAIDTSNKILVSPNGTLNDFFNAIPINTGSHTMTLSLIQSTDKGNTWSSKPISVGSILSMAVTDPNNGQNVDASYFGVDGGVNVFFDVAEDPSNGNLYAVWQDARFSNFQHNSIAFSESTNGGATWSAPIQINQTPSNIPNGDQQAFLPSIAVAANGTVAVTYYDFRNNGTGPGLLTDYWLVQGNPSGAGGLANPANWGNEVRLTNTSFNMETASVRRGYFIGDYQGLAAAGNSFDALFAATNGTDPGDIFFRDPSVAGSTGTATIPQAAGVVPSNGGAAANVIGPRGQASNGQTAPLPADQLLTLLGNNLGFNATQAALTDLVNEVSSLDSAFLARFDSLLSMGFDGYALNAIQENWLHDLLFASLF